MRCKLMIVLAVSLATASFASAQSITNVDANQEGKAIAVTYDLKEKSNISLFITQNGGQTKTAIPAKYTSGDVGKNVSPGVEKKILWRVLDQYPNEDFRGENLSFIVQGKPCMAFFAILNAGYSLDSGFNMGLTFGQLGSIGWYGKVMTTLSMPKSTEYECDENGYVDGTLPAYSGASAKFKAYGVAGATIRLGAPVYLNAGVGYGLRKYAWETLDGKWVKNMGGSYSGVAVDAGLIVKFGKLAISAGATYLSKSVDFCAGVGVVF